MKLYVFFLIWLIPRKLLSAEKNNLKLHEYLQQQSEILSEQLDKKLRNIRHSNAEEQTILGTYQHTAELEDPNVNIFTFFNKTFFAIDNEVFIATLGDNFNMNFYTDFKHKRTIFFKVIEYQNTGFMALSTENEILMYTFPEKESTPPELIQRVSAPYSSDGIFFTNEGGLYFASSTNRGEHIGLITLYKWLGSHFDVLETLQTTGVVKMNSFSDKSSEIIVAAQRLPEGSMVHVSSIYAFRQDKVRKIQQLNTNRPTHMDVFFQNRVPYVLIYEEANSQQLYKWNGFQMVLVNRLHWKHKVDKSIVVYSNTIPLIVQPQLDKVFVFKPQDEDIELYQTKDYLANYSDILDINKGINENGYISFIAGLNEDNIINIYGMSFEAHAEMEREQEGSLRICFNNLELKLYDRRKKINQMNDSPSLDVGDVSHSRKRRATNGTTIESKLDDIKTRLNKVRPFAKQHEDFPNQFIVNGKAIIKGNITTKTLKANKKLTFKKVNNKNWTPEFWLQYNQEQVIKGPVRANKINTKVLAANGDAALLFQSLLRNNGNQTISGNYKINNLSATKLFTKSINNIDVDNIYKTGNNSSKIKGTKSFQNILSERANVTKINGKNTEDILSMQRSANEPKSTIKFAPHVFVDNIEVESIDKINWLEFEQSLFKIDEDNFIQGSLIVPEIKTKYLQAKTLNGVNVEHIMTKSTDQVINSSVEFNNVKASSIECDTVNDVDITKSVQIDQNGTVIKGHVRIEEIDVLQDLELLGDLGDLFFMQEGDHIFGTNESDLLQRYLGKVVINGNLYVNDFSALPNTTIFLRGNEYTMEVLHDYWNKHGKQVIPVHFEAQNGISTTHLKTKFLNEIPMKAFALNNKDTQINSPLFFENVTVEGNVILEKDNSTTNSLDLDKLASAGVKIHGGPYVLKGKKVFLNTLEIKDLNSSGKNIGIPLNGRGVGVVKKVIVKGNLISSNIHAKTVNEMNVSNFKEHFVPLNKPQNLTRITMKKVTVENLNVKTINGRSIEEYLDKLQNILKKKQIGTVHIKENMTMRQVNDLKTINEHNIDDILVENDLQEEFIGDVKFTGKVTIGNLKARTIDDIYFPNLTQRFLHKKSNQTVTAVYTFANLKTVHLYADNINGKDVGKLIDISSKEPQQITAPNGIVFKNIKLDKSVEARNMVPCDIYQAMQGIRYPESQEWAEVEIFGNVTLLDENCDLVRILEKSVKIDQKNVISAPVIIKGHCLTKKVITNSDLNGINLAELIDDVVLRDSEDEQVITGHTIFSNTINADTVTVLENADIPIVNNIDVRELYSRVIRKDQVNNITVLGKKTFFTGLQANRFLVEKISGMAPENIVSLSNLSKITHALFDTVSVQNDFNVGHINSHDLTYILNNRLFTNTTEKQIAHGVYYFNDLEIIDNLETSSINGIDIQNVVFDVEKQKITGAKRFLEKITIFGNVSVGYLNGINLTEAYSNAVLHGRSEIINGSITILNPVTFEGNLTAQTLNGYPIDQLKSVINETSFDVEEGVIFNMREKVKTIIQNSLPMVEHMPNEFMYIERSDNLQVQIKNAVDARVTTMKDHVLIHIQSEESDETCDLPEGCSCPSQYTVELSPHNSVSYLLNKERQRVYSYDNGALIIHLITNSISTDSKCRTNQSQHINEETTMAWSTTSVDNSTGAFHIHPMVFTGYISGVEFFTLNGVTYGIIARYYDPVADTHDLDCTVVRFTEDKTSAYEIQKIPTHGVWTLYLLHTAQGVTIVIGNLGDQPSTEIHRFNGKTEQFEFLRSIAYGCTKTVGVVLGTDSLIILANGEAPLQILKYHPEWDNYYYYQMFALGEPVLGISVFYVGGFGISEAYLCIVTEEHYRVYSFQYIDGWKLESRGSIRGLRNLIPFELNDQLYLFAPSTGESSLLRVVKHGTGDN